MPRSAGSPIGRGIDFFLESRSVTEVRFPADEYPADADDPAGSLRLPGQGERGGDETRTPTA